MKSLRKLFIYVRPYLRGLGLAIFGSLFFQGLGKIFAMAIVPLFYQRLIDALHSGIPVSKIYTIGIYLLVSFTVVSLSFRFSSYITAWFQKHLISRLGSAVFRLFIEKDYHFYLDNFAGALVAKYSKFTTAVYRIYEIINFDFISGILGLMVMLIILSRKSFPLVGFFIAWVILYVFVSLYWSRIRAQSSLARSKSFSQLNGLVSDGVSNISITKSYGMEEFEVENFQSLNNQVARKTFSDWVVFIKAQISSSILNIIFQGGNVFLGIYFWDKGLISTGFIVLLFLYSRQLISNVRSLARSLPNLASALSDTSEIIDILEEENKVTDCHIKNFISGNNTISFKNISFTYPNGDHVFENFNLDIPEGQKIGIVGKSGSGKTTLVKLLLRFYDPDKGTVSVGKNLIKNLNQQEYRKQLIAFIPQETTLFHRSLRENITYGNQEAGEELFNEVVRSSYVDEFVTRLDEDYETKVGERAIRLSGGQRQRVGIARAMIKQNAPILIMDEATSALDSQSEQYIQESFEKLSEDRTTIVIAHRLSTIQKMDRIIVMDHGKIIEDGTHDDLLLKQGHYAQLWNSQIGGFIQD